MESEEKLSMRRERRDEGSRQREKKRNAAQNEKWGQGQVSPLPSTSPDAAQQRKKCMRAKVGKEEEERELG